MVKIQAKSIKVIQLGHRGENEARQIIFDLTEYISTYGPGTARLLHQRHGDPAPYIVPAVQDGDTLTWTVTDADTAAPGTGSAELQWTVNNVLAKSDIWNTRTKAALDDGATEPPAGAEGWYQQLIAYIDSLRDEGIIEEQIAAAVEAYLADNPVDVPVTSVNGQTGAVQLTAADVGALAQDDLQTGVDAALAQAKASGEFDGQQGEQGVQGETGPAGADGHTPEYGVDYGTPEQISGIAQQAAEILQPEVDQIKDDLAYLAPAIVCQSSGYDITLDDSLDRNLHSLRVYGKTTRDGTPTPDNPVELVSVGSGGSIAVSIGTSKEDTSQQTLPISTPNGLPGINVTYGGNYTDSTGQKWICDEVDFARGVYVQRVCVMTIAPTDITGLQSINSYGIANFMVGLKERAASDNTSKSSAMCNRFITKSSVIANTSTESFMISRPLIAYIRISSETCDTVYKMKEYVTNNQTQIAYILETPIETALDAETLAAYAALRTNYQNTTLINDAGAWMKIGYQADTKLYIDKQFAELRNAIVSLGGNI